MPGGRKNSNYPAEEKMAEPNAFQFKAVTVIETRRFRPARFGPTAVPPKKGAELST